MFGEIQLCQFPFTSGAVSKIRPVLILFDLQADAIVCRITSAAPRGAADIVLHDWQAAGLLTTSVARIDRLVTAERTVFLRPLGALSLQDAEAVRTAWNRTMRL
jgi:mRNA-degrading endonuclease toxin of MazEF toxin-antitoxin module